jgi:hypothetical protein
VDVGVAVDVCVAADVGVFVGVFVKVLVGVSDGVAVGVAVSVDVCVTVGVGVDVLVGVDVGVCVEVDVGVGVSVGARIATVIVLLPETESSKRGDVCTMPLKSTRAVAVRIPTFTLIGHPIDVNVRVVSEGDEKFDATVIGVPPGVPNAFGQRNVTLIVSASQAVVVGGLVLVFDMVSVYVSVDPFTTKPVGF